MSERHPELEPDPWNDDDDDRPMPGARRQRVVRVVVLVALGAMVLPLVLSAYGVAKSGADRACAVYAAAYDSDATGYRTSFDLFAQGGPGWVCSAVSEHGTERRLGNLGPMPMLPQQPTVGVPEERDA